MTTALAPQPIALPESPASRPRLISRVLVLVFVADFVALTSLYLVLAVVPLYATSIGLGGAAGAASAAIMLSSMVTELAAPRLMARYGYRVTFAVSLLLLGVPALAMTMASSLGAIMMAGALHGLGFGLMVVAAGSLVSEVIPAERRGEALGVYGAAIVLPGVVGLPLGVWLAANAGPSAVFVTAAVFALSGLLVVPFLPGRTAAIEAPVGIFAALRNPALARPSLVFFATTVAAGIVVGFLPLAVGASSNVATAALLTQSLCATVARWLAGRYGDKHGASKLLIPGLVVAATGILALFFIATPLAVIGGMVLFGAGFGVVQNASLAIMLERVSTSEYSTVNAVWSVAYDSGWGLGAAAFGAAAIHTGFPVGFAFTGALMLAALSPARRDRKHYAAA
jgi:MFS family permease